jgi:hypothetical protein
LLCADTVCRCHAEVALTAPSSSSSCEAAANQICSKVKHTTRVHSAEGIGGLLVPGLRAQPSAAILTGAGCARRHLLLLCPCARSAMLAEAVHSVVDVANQVGGQQKTAARADRATAAGRQRVCSRATVIPKGCRSTARTALRRVCVGGGLQDSQPIVEQPQAGSAECIQRIYCVTAGGVPGSFSDATAAWRCLATAEKPGYSRKATPSCVLSLLFLSRCLITTSSRSTQLLAQHGPINICSNKACQ